MFKIGLTTAICAMSMFGAATAVADGSALRLEIERLMDAHWDAKSMRDQQASDLDYEKSLQQFPDWRLSYAQALIQIAQYRHQAAGEIVGELLDVRKDDWRLHRGKAWLSLASRQFEQGLAELDAWVKALPAADPKDPNDLEGREAAMDIGRMLGFLEVAVPKETAPASRDRFASRWALMLSADRLAAFESGRSKVKSEHARLLGDRDKTIKEGAEKAAKEKDEKLKQLDVQQADIVRQRAELKKEVDSLRDQLKAEMDEVRRADAPLQRAMARLEGQAVAMDRDLAILTSDIARLQRRLDFERDPLIRAEIRREIARLDSIAARRDADLLGVEREFDVLGLQRQSLLLRQQRAQNDLGQQAEKASRTNGDLAKLDRRLNSQRQRVLRTSSSTSGSARSLAARAGVIATYMAFPLVEEKLRLMKLLN